MILNVPTHEDLADTAAAWLHHAWNVAIEEARNVQEFGFALEEAEEAHGAETVQKALDEYWDGKRLELNNALSLLQQSIELFLKARIAEVSPFLLIAGEPRSWPAPDKAGDIDFTDVKTIDAAQLCRAAQLVSKVALPNEFVEFYERLRKTRNKIVHLNGGNAKAEVRSVLLEVLVAHKFLFPNQGWVEFLRRGERIAKSDDDYMFILFGDSEDVTNDEICSEVEAALFELQPAEAQTFFGYDPSKQSFCCPTCLDRRSKYSDRTYELAQKQNDSTVKCLSCLSVFSVEDYKADIMGFYSYLADEEQRRIADDLDEAFG